MAAIRSFYSDIKLLTYFSVFHSIIVVSLCWFQGINCWTEEPNPSIQFEFECSLFLQMKNMLHFVCNLSLSSWALSFISVTISPVGNNSSIFPLQSIFLQRASPSIQSAEFLSYTYFAIIRKDLWYDLFLLSPACITSSKLLPIPIKIRLFFLKHHFNLSNLYNLNYFEAAVW